MMRILGVLGMAGALSLAAPAQAMEIDRDVSCLEPAALAAYLDRAFQEAPVASARLDNGNRVEIFASRRGTWNMVELTADGFACIAGHGEGLRLTVEPKATGPGPRAAIPTAVQ